MNLTNRLLTLLSAEGLIVRGRPRGGWTSSQFTWSAAPERPAGRRAPGPSWPAAGWPRSARRCCPTCSGGPGDRGQVRQAVGELDLTEVDLQARPASCWPGTTSLDGPTEPWAALLPALDPTAMGWRERAWYVGEHTAALFDRSGNIGPTVWWDGRIVGGWAQRADGEIAVRMLEDVGAEAAAVISGRGPAPPRVDRARREDHPSVPDATGTRTSRPPKTPESLEARHKTRSGEPSSAC